MDVRNLYMIKKEDPHSGTVSAWNLFTKKDFQSTVLFFNDNLVPPGITIEPHQHRDMEEVYYIIGGIGKVIIGEEERGVNEGDAVYIPPDKVHSLTNTGSRPLRFICLGATVLTGCMAKHP